MNNTPQDPWLSCDGTDEMRPFIGNRKGFELLKAEIDALLSSENGIHKVECRSLGFPELRIQESFPENPPMDAVGKVMLCGFLGTLLLILWLALVGLDHLIS